MAGGRHRGRGRKNNRQRGGKKGPQSPPDERLWRRVTQHFDDDQWQRAWTAESITAWITDRSARVTHEFNEEKTRRFEWFLSSDQSKATLIEVFDDCDGAVTRVQNLMSSEIAAEWMERFEIWVSRAFVLWDRVS